MPKNDFAPLFLILLSSIMLLYQVAKPFWGHHDFNNAFYGNMARNLVRFSILDTKLAQVTSSGRPSVSDFSFHTHHPPLLIWALGVSYLLFGVTELSTRLVPIAFSVGTLFTFYMLIKKTVNSKTAVIASFFWIVTPLYIYFGKMAVQEIPVLFFVLLGLYSYAAGKVKLLYFSTFLAALSGWPGYYLIPTIWLWSLLRTGKIAKNITALPIVAIGVFAFHLFQNHVVTGSTIGGGFLNSFVLRSSDIPLFEYARKELSWILAYFTKPFVTLAAGGLIISLIHRKALILVLFFFGILHLIFFRQAAFRHDYLIYYLLPAVSLGAALFLTHMIRNKFFLTSTTLLIIAFSLSLSFRFTGALQGSNYGRIAVQAGKNIATKTSPNERVTLINKEIYNNFDWQVRFYADRNLTIIPE